VIAFHQLQAFSDGKGRLFDHRKGVGGEQTMNTSSPVLNGFSDQNSSPILNQANPKVLNPHPWNFAIYGKDEDVSELISLISASRWVKPLVITPENRIISGHQRWKAVLALGWKSVPVEVREFPDELAELEALLLENASRFKTTEQKVREALAWKEVEAHKARTRQISLAGTRPNSKPDLVENFPPGQKGKTRDRLAKLVGLGSGRTYEKAAKVVEVIDKETSSGNLETAQTLRRVLNSKSVNAAVKLLSPINSDEGNRIAASPQHSCWNCQHRGELIENHSFYCYCLGVLSLLEKSADTRGAECELWSYRETDSDEAKTTHSTFTITLPAHLQPLLQDAARTTEMSLVDWATRVLESAALATCSTISCTRQLRRAAKR